MTPPVSQSITRKSASNLALAFVLLPKQKREGMAALYAFCREVDDIADEETSPMELRRTLLEAWREDVKTACEGGQPKFPVNRELQPVINRHRLPFAHFDELIRGVEMDLTITRYADLDALEAYCYRVASVVGLLSIEIFGYQDAACREYAIHLGKALQLTNILRDVRVDAQRGRIYLPQDELTRQGVAPEEILRFEYSGRFKSVATQVAQRARYFYQRAGELLPEVDRRAMAPAELMASVYWKLLQKLEQREFNVFGLSPTRLSKWQKLWLVLRTWCRLAAGVSVPSYGG